jgi:hypothetical protein
LIRPINRWQRLKGHNLERASGGRRTKPRDTDIRHPGRVLGQDSPFAGELSSAPEYVEHRGHAKIGELSQRVVRGWNMYVRIDQTGQGVRSWPSMLSEAVDSVPSKTRAITPFSIHTSRCSSTRAPSKTRTLRINTGRGVDCAETATRHETSVAPHPN